MLRFLPLAVIAAAAATCGTAPAEPSAVADSSGAVSIARRQVVHVSRELADSVVVPSHPVDRRIRRELHRAIANDAELTNRAVSFVVRRGDISVTGIVRSEAERKKINDLAMSIDGVKSVANAVQVAP